MVTKARFAALALALPDVTQVPHFDRLAFRVPRRIFATLGPQGDDVNFRLNAELQASVVQAWPKAFAPVPGGWGRMGWTRCLLSQADEADLRRVLDEAHALAGAPPAKRAAKKVVAKKKKKKKARR